MGNGANNKNARRIGHILIQAARIAQRFSKGHSAPVHLERALLDHLPHHEDFQGVITRHKKDIARIEQLILRQVAVLHQRIQREARIFPS